MKRFHIWHTKIDHIKNSWKICSKGNARRRLEKEASNRNSSRISLKKSLKRLKEQRNVTEKTFGTFHIWLVNFTYQVFRKSTQHCGRCYTKFLGILKSEKYDNTQEFYSVNHRFIKQIFCSIVLLIVLQRLNYTDRPWLSKMCSNCMF